MIASNGSRFGKRIVRTSQPPAKRNPKKDKQWSIDDNCVIFSVACCLLPTDFDDMRLFSSDERIDIGGYKLHLRIEGSAEPTVVIDSGCGGTAAEWKSIQHQVARVSRVVAYDRAGCGLSDPGPLPRTSSRMATELELLLAVANIEGPLVLVGQSLGGMNVRMFATRNLQRVAGMILIDAAHEDAFRRLPRPYVQYEKRQMKRGSGIGRNETDAITVSSSELRKSARSLGSIPLKVLTAGVKWMDRPRGTPLEPLSEAWLELQRDLASLSSSGIHEIVEDAGHSIHHDRPDVVIAAITSMVREIRGEPAVRKADAGSTGRSRPKSSTAPRRRGGTGSPRKS